MQQVAIDTFDAAGVKTRSERTTFDYDAAGFRVSTLHEVDADADGGFETRTRTEFLAERRNPTGYTQTIQERVTNADSGAEIKTTVYTLGLDAISQTVFTPGGPSEGETHVFLYDGHGSVRLLANMLAAVVESYNFDAYGNAHGFDPAAALTSLLYSGEHFNAAIGQQYLRARWYDAMTGRFGRLDPFAGNFNDPQSLHKYLYVHGDPISSVDPLGMWPSVSGMISAISIGSALVAFGAGTYLGAQAGKPIRGALAGGVLGAGILIARTKGIKALGKALLAGLIAGGLAGLITAGFEYATYNGHMTDAQISKKVAEFRFTLFEAFSYAFFNAVTGIGEVENGNLVRQFFVAGGQGLADAIDAGASGGSAPDKMMENLIVILVDMTLTFGASHASHVFRRFFGRQLAGAPPGLLTELLRRMHTGLKTVATEGTTSGEFWKFSLDLLKGSLTKGVEKVLEND